MAPSDFAKASIDEVVEQLTQDEAILLTAGVGFWHTHGVPRLGVPPLKVSDGPNGAPTAPATITQSISPYTLIQVYVEITSS